MSESGALAQEAAAGRDVPGDRRAARIARLLEAEVIARGWPIGESLGSEQSLQQRFAVSRSVLREAVRLVEHHQVARMRRGPNGGLFVTVPDAAPATRAIVIYLEHIGTTIDDLLNARLLLEPLAAALAAQRIDEGGIVALRAAVAAAKDRDAEEWAPSQFHAVLGELTRNPLLQLFIDVLIRLTARYGAGSRPVDPDAVSTARRRLHAGHAVIAEAVARGEVARAAMLTEEHVRSVTAWLREHHDPAHARTIRPQATSGKRAEVLAATIWDDIAAGGWRPDAVFGTETELVERYGVSRSILREAVRLLEYHSIARMRRGPGGGLVVTEPQVRASINAIALYLEYRRPIREDLCLVRDAIEVDNVAHVVRRRADTDVAAFVDGHRRVIHDATAQSDLQSSAREELLFHAGISELAGNSVFTLFQRILVELLRRRWDSAVGERAVPEGHEPTEIGHDHAAIIEAVIAGDDAVARYRTRRHMETATSWWW